MARIARHFLKFPSPTFYHLICHLQPELPYLRPSEKEFLLRLLRRLTQSFSISVLSYAILGNHFHLLVKTQGPNSLSEQEAIERALLLYPQGVVFRHPGLYWRRKLTDLSFFMKELNQRLSQHYNRIMKRRGHLFYDRFKSVVVGAEGVLAVSVYIELNAVRAGLSKSLSGYRWVSYAGRRAGEGGWLMGLEEVLGMGLRAYGKLLQQVGRQEREGKGRIEEEEEIVLQVLRYRGEGLVYGSVEFVEGILSRLPFRRRRRQRMGGLVLA